MRYDITTADDQTPDFDLPTTELDRYSTNGLAMTAFLERLSVECATAYLNNCRLLRTEPMCDNDYPCITNDGSRFDCDRFWLHAYDWSNDADNSVCFLDKKTGAAANWYKYVPRGLCVNDACLDMLENGSVSRILQELLIATERCR